MYRLSAEDIIDSDRCVVSSSWLVVDTIESKSRFDMFLSTCSCLWVRYYRHLLVLALTPREISFFFLLVWTISRESMPITLEGTSLLVLTHLYAGILVTVFSFFSLQVLNLVFKLG